MLLGFVLEWIERRKRRNQKLSSDIVRLHNELRYLCDFNTIYLLSKGNENEIYWIYFLFCLSCKTMHNKKIFFESENFMLETMHERLPASDIGKRWETILVLFFINQSCCWYFDARWHFDDDDESITIEFTYKAWRIKLRRVWNKFKIKTCMVNYIKKISMSMNEQYFC